MEATVTTSVVPQNRTRRGGGMVNEDKLEFLTFEGIEPIMSFDQMGIKDDLLRDIYNYGFGKSSAIQQWAVRPIIEGLSSRKGENKITIKQLEIVERLSSRLSEAIKTQQMDEMKKRST